MKQYPDKHFDLAIVDPPYGIGSHWKKYKTQFKKTTYDNKNIPDKKYFDELFRVTKETIIFGYNYFTDILGSTNYLIIWDKISADNSFTSMAEIAYSTFHKPMQIFKVAWDGARKGKETGIKKIHPHQKPIELYEKILLKYAKQGDKILDTHFGSGSIGIACNNMGLDLTAAEIDKEYFVAACKRNEEAECRK